MSSIVDKSTLVDSQDSKSIKARSKFDLSHHHLTTLPFGEYVPFFSMECVNGDNINLRSQHSLNTFTLKSPILSNIRMRKDYFSVPMEAILPFNWDKIITNPLFGDDIDAEQVNCVLDLSIFNYQESTNNKSFVTLFNENFSQAQTKKIGLQLNLLTIAELFFSNGSLLSRLGYNFNKLFSFSNSDEGVGYDNGIDDIIEDYYNKLPGTLNIHYFSDNSEVKTATFNLDTAEQKRKFHDFALTHCFDPTYDVVELTPITVSYQMLPIDSAGKKLKFNIAPVCAYQIACAHYLTNDKVDSIYSAELYRQLMNYCLSYDVQQLTFKYNGVETRYDYLSGYSIRFAFENMIDYFINPDPIASLNLPFNYFINLLGMRRSLRYLDYFTGAKTHPLALGDTSVKVSSGNSVDVVDVTKGIQMQRFLNFVNRTGRKFEEYISKLNGRYVAPDYHNPQFLGSTVESLYNPTVENTGTEQFTKPNSITSTMKGESERFAFQFDCDRPSIIIGIVSFDIVRAYANNVVREGGHIDRFDYFNPFLQHIGDQPIFGYEYFYNGLSAFDTNYFGYQTRHSEYKTAISRADSGFIDGSLPSWCFLNESIFTPLGQVSISSDIIRSFPEELDKFYLNLPGISLSKYFHFIVDFYNMVDASRPMIANPNIL